MFEPAVDVGRVRGADNSHFSEGGKSQHPARETDWASREGRPASACALFARDGNRAEEVLPIHGPRLQRRTENRGPGREKGEWREK